MMAYKHSCKVFHQQNPLTIPCGRRPRKQNRSRNLLHHWASQGTWARSNVEKAHASAEHFVEVPPHPSESEPAEEEALMQLLSSNHQSTVSRELNFKESSTA
jgi:hypothetical protein